MKLLEKGYDVTIVAKNVPGDLDLNYTSPWAGADWHSFASDEDKEMQDFDKPGYTEFLSLAKNEPRSGIVVRNSVCYDTTEYAEKRGSEIPWFSHFAENFRLLPKKSLPDGMAQGFSFDTVVITTPIYLQYLLAKCLERGATLKRSTVYHVNDAFKLHSAGPANCVVNCTGLLAAKLEGVKDKNVYPIRGQTILVENNCKSVMSVMFYDEENANEMTYIMPRKEGGCIIGGCFLENDSCGELNKEMSVRILERAKKWCPELVDPAKGNPTEFKVVRENVGLRPARKGGYRIEVDPSNPRIVHNYGHGGAGYQSSYGTCEKACALVDSVCKKSKL